MGFGHQVSVFFISLFVFFATQATPNSCLKKCKKSSLFSLIEVCGGHQEPLYLLLLPHVTFVHSPVNVIDKKQTYLFFSSIRKEMSSQTIRQPRVFVVSGIPVGFAHLSCQVLCLLLFSRGIDVLYRLLTTLTRTIEEFSFNSLRLHKKVRQLVLRCLCSSPHSAHSLNQYTIYMLMQRIRQIVL